MKSFGIILACLAAYFGIGLALLVNFGPVGFFILMGILFLTGIGIYYFSNEDF